LSCCNQTLIQPLIRKRRQHEIANNHVYHLLSVLHHLLLCHQQTNKILFFYRNFYHLLTIIFQNINVFFKFETHYDYYDVAINITEYERRSASVLDLPYTAGSRTWRAGSSVVQRDNLLKYGYVNRPLLLENRILIVIEFSEKETQQPVHIGPSQDNLNLIHSAIVEVDACHTTPDLILAHGRWQSTYYLLFTPFKIQDVLAMINAGLNARYTVPVIPGFKVSWGGDGVALSGGSVPWPWR